MKTREFYRVTPKCKTFSSQNFNTLVEAEEFVIQEGIWKPKVHNYYDKHQIIHYTEYWREYAKTLVITKITQTEESVQRLTDET